jgi:hypothetical protein
MSSKSVKLNFIIDKIAKTSGGDKYICESNPDFNIYIPQKISRPDKQNVCENLIITIDCNLTVQDDKSSIKSEE